MKKRWGRSVLGLVFAYVLVCNLGFVRQAQAGTINVPGDHATIQAAINAAGTGDTVLVDDGIYTENINFSGKAIILQSVNGAANTTIDGNQNGSVVTFASGEGSGSVLDGFTVTNGSGTVDESGTHGGGIYCDNTSPSISNCIISNNTVTGLASSGGGIACYNTSSPIIANCSIFSNSCNNTLNNEGGGGGIVCGDSSSPTISNCNISNNSAYDGGGIACDDSSSPTITNCIISGNAATGTSGDGDGGGIACGDSSPTIINCRIIDNSATDTGGGIACASSSMIIINCTIANNRTDGGSGGAIAYFFSSSPTVVNSILWGNGLDEIYLDGTSNINITYSDVQHDSGVYPGTGNINETPLFVGGGDYHLTASSPCIDTGTSEGAPSDDIDGDARPQGTGYDMGADEYTEGCAHDGDVNQDGGITPADALLAFQHYLGLTQLDECQQDRADVNGDGNITPADALCIFQKYLGLTSCLD